MTLQAQVNNSAGRLGTILPTFNTEARKGWLWLDGTTTYKKSSYPDFIAMFGTSPIVLAVAGDTTLFRLQDMRGRMMIGAGTGVAVGQLAGNASVKLTAANLPKHSHTYSRPSNPPGNVLSVIGSITTTLLAAVFSSQARNVNQTTITDNQATGDAGSDNPDAISLLPPVFGVNFIVFAGLPQS